MTRDRDTDRSARFDVLLSSAGPTPSAVSDAIRTASIPTGRLVTSAQAEALVGRAPVAVAERVSRLQATRLELALRAAGADCAVLER